MDEFMGTIKLFGFPFVPQGWLQCNGQILMISQYQALYSLIGTIYGGNGTTTFALPDLRGRAAIHNGQSPGLANYSIGQKGGLESVVLTTGQLPSHIHQVAPANLPVTGNLTTTASLQATSQTGTSASPVNGNYLSTTNDEGGTGADVKLYSSNTPNVNLGGLSVNVSPNGMVANTSGAVTTATGANQPLPVLNPYLVANYCICVEGIYPPRS